MGPKYDLGRMSLPIAQWLWKVARKPALIHLSINQPQHSLAIEFGYFKALLYCI